MKNIQWYGWKKDVHDKRDLYKLVRVPATLPDKVDLRQGLPAPYNQGELGSCTANAIAAAIQFDLLKQKLPVWMPSRLFIYWNERDMEGTINEDSGAQIRDGVKSINTLGVCPEETTTDAAANAIWPYDVAQFAVKPPQPCYDEADENIALKYERVPQVASALQAMLAQGYPVVFGFTVYESFESQEVAASGVVSMPGTNEQSVGGHAVLLCGYDATTKMFLVRNSWGDWGQGGYFWMPFAYVCDPFLANDFWTIELMQ